LTTTGTSNISRIFEVSLKWHLMTARKDGQMVEGRNEARRPRPVWLLFRFDSGLHRLYGLKR
jgi:hypothetical protein